MHYNVLLQKKILDEKLQKGVSYIVASLFSIYVKTTECICKREKTLISLTYTLNTIPTLMFRLLK